MCYRGVDFGLRELQRVRNEADCFNVFNILGVIEEKVKSIVYHVDTIEKIIMKSLVCLVWLQ